MTYVSNLIVLSMYMVDDSDKTVWWDLSWVAQGKAGLRKEKLHKFLGRGTESREGKLEDVETT